MVATLPRFGHQGGLETDQPTQVGEGVDIIQPPWTSPAQADLAPGPWQDLHSYNYS